MKLEPMLQDASDLLIDDESADSTPMIQVCCKQLHMQWRCRCVGAVC